MCNQPREALAGNAATRGPQHSASSAQQHWYCSSCSGSSSIHAQLSTVFNAAAAAAHSVPQGYSVAGTRGATAAWMRSCRAYRDCLQRTATHIEVCTVPCLALVQCTKSCVTVALRPTAQPTTLLSVHMASWVSWTACWRCTRTWSGVAWSAGAKLFGGLLYSTD